MFDLLLESELFLTLLALFNPNPKLISFYFTFFLVELLIKTSSLNGISNFESAVATSSISQELEAHPVEIIEVKTDSKLQEQNKSNKPKSIQSEEIEIQGDWQPDLSGWDVSYGLPK